MRYVIPILCLSAALAAPAASAHPIVSSVSPDSVTSAGPQGDLEIGGGCFINDCEEPDYTVTELEILFEFGGTVLSSSTDVETTGSPGNSGQQIFVTWPVSALDGLDGPVKIYVTRTSMDQNTNTRVLTSDAISVDVSFDNSVQPANIPMQIAVRNASNSARIPNAWVIAERSDFPIGASLYLDPTEPGGFIYELLNANVIPYTVSVHASGFLPQTLSNITPLGDGIDHTFFLTPDPTFTSTGAVDVILELSSADVDQGPTHVLARDADTFEASKGSTRGLSLFLCPRTLPDGTPNNVRVQRLEHKLGIHGSPTAAIQFDEAQAWRVGEKGAGFKAMLTLMNNARLGVAAQGVGISEAAIHTAVAYAKERKQFGVPIGDQPLMKNMLSKMVLALEGSRALLYRACILVDRNRAIEEFLERGEGGVDEAKALQQEHERNATRIRLLTPLAKYLATEACDEISRKAIQVHGGIGFMAESEVGKLHHDAIITTIYEGTSEIQVSFALKEIGKGALGVVFEEIAKELDAAVEDPKLVEFAGKGRGGMGRILAACAALLADFGYALLSAQLLADVVIDVVVAAELLKQAQADPARFDLAASWINQKMLDVDAKTRRIQDGGSARIDRCEKILKLVG